MARRGSVRGAGGFALPPADEPSPLAAALRPVTSIVARRRRLLAAVCAGAAAVLAVSALTPSSTATAADAPAVSALPAGAGAGPAGDADRVAVAVRLADAAGLLLLRAGSHAEVLAGPAPDTGGGVAGAGLEGEVLAPDAVVLAVPQPPGGGASTTGGSGSGVSGSGVSGLLGGSGGADGLDGVVLVAVPPSDARRIAAASGSRALSVAVSVPVSAAAGIGAP